MAYTMKEVVERTGMTPHTLRFYEKEGVLPIADRDGSGARTFSEHYIDCVETVQALRSTGLPLSEIKQYVEMFHGGERTLSLRKSMLIVQRNKVEEQIGKLIKTLEKLNYKLALIDAQESKFSKLP